MIIAEEQPQTPTHVLEWLIKAKSSKAETCIYKDNQVEADIAPFLCLLFFPLPFFCGQITVTFTNIVCNSGHSTSKKLQVKTTLLFTAVSMQLQLPYKTRFRSFVRTHVMQSTLINEHLFFSYLSFYEHIIILYSSFPVCRYTQTCMVYMNYLLLMILQRQ